MNDYVGGVAYDVIAEFDSASFEENVAKGLARSRDEFGRFVKENRTITQNMMRDMGAIMNSGTSSAMGVLKKNMTSAADAAGKGFTARIAAAAKSIPKSLGESLSTGAISVVSTAGEKLGEHVTAAISDRIQKSAPFWKKSFQQSFQQAANVDTTSALTSLAAKIKGGGDAAGKSFQEALGDRFSKAGIVASAKLGDFTAQIANKIVPGASTAAARGVEALTAPFRDGFPTGLKVAMGLAGGVGAIALISRLRKGGSDAAKAAGDGMASEGEVAGKRGGLGLISGFQSAMSGLASLIAKGVSSASSAVASAASAVGKAGAQAMGDALKLGAQATGAIISGVLGTSLAKGFKRVSAIENAEASMRGLAATSAHVPEIMDAVGAAMSGTAFGLDQGAKAASQFAAAGVPISEMQRHLGSLANTAAAAGGDFDGVAGIFSKVAANGKVTGEVLNQLTDRGLAALPALAEQLGVTAEEASKRVSEGAVSFDDFSTAMDKAMGAVAIEQAKTFQGLMGNVGAAMGRFGAIMQKPFFEATKAALPGVINLFDQFKVVIEPLAQIIADRLIPAAEAIGAKLSELKFDAPVAGADQLFGTLAALAPVLGGVAAMFAGPLLSSIPVVGGMFAGLTGPVGLLLGSLVALFAVDPTTLLTGVDTVLSTLPGMLDTVVSTVTGIIPQMVERFAENASVLAYGVLSIVETIVAGVATLAPKILPALAQMVSDLAIELSTMAPTFLDAAVVMFSGIVSGLSQSLPILINALPGIVSGLTSGLTALMPGMVQSGIGMMRAISEGLLDAIPHLVSLLPGMITMLLDSIVAMLPELISGGLAIVNGLVAGIVDAMPRVVSAIVKSLPRIVDAIVAAAPLMLDAALELISGLVTGFTEGVPMLISAAVDALPKLIDGLLNALPQLITAGIDLVLGLVTGVVRAIPQIIDAVVSAIPQVISGLIAVMPQLITGGIDLVLGLITGIIDAIPQLVAAVVEGIPQIIGGLLGALPQLVAGGVQLIFALIGGIAQATPQIISTVVGLIPRFVSGLMAQFPQLTAFFVNAWNSITTTISNVWNGVVTFFSGIWTKITSGATTAWTNFKNWITTYFNALVLGVRVIWDQLTGFFTGLWDGIRTTTSNVWNAITGWLTGVFNGAVSTARSIWDGLTGFFRGLWDGVTGTFNTFLGFVTKKPKEAFEGAVAAIGKAWDGIKELAAKPVRFVVDTVINGLIGTINHLPGVNVPKVALPPGFARGGILPGMSRMSDGDSQIIAARPGEGMLVSEALRTNEDRRAFLAANAQGRRGVGFASMVNGYAKGGLITPLDKGTWTMSQPYSGSHNGVDMAAASGTPILAAADGLVQLAQSVNMGGNEIYLAHKRLATRYSHLSAFNVRAGQTVKQGQVIGRVGSTGMSTGPHLHYMVHNPNDGGNGFAYANHVNPGEYLGTYGKAFDGFDIVESLTSWATDKFKQAFPGAGMWIDAAGGILNEGVQQLTNWGKSLLGFDSDSRGRTGNGPAKASLYDSGGVFPHGTAGVNLSGKPEAVLTNSEWQLIAQLVAGLGAGSLGDSAIGQNIASGLAAGIIGGTGVVSKASTALTDALVSRFKTDLEIHSPSRVFKRLAGYIGEGLVEGTLGSVAKVKSTGKKLADAVISSYSALRDERAKLVKAQNAMWDRAREIDWSKNWDAAMKKAVKLDKQIADNRAAIASIDRSIGTGKASTAAEKSLLARISSGNKQLVAIAEQRTSVSKKLTKAQQALEKLEDARFGWVDDIQTKISDRAKITNRSSVTGMAETLQARIAETKSFASKIDKLKSLGANAETLRELTENFAQTGSTRAADALLAGGKTGIKQVQDLQAQLAKEGAKLGTNVGNVMYTAGADAARGLIEGLEKQQASLEAAGKKIADALTAQVKKTLKIKSPSRVLAELGEFGGQGFAGGFLSTETEVRAAAASLASSSADEIESFTARGLGSRLGAPAKRMDYYEDGAEFDEYSSRRRRGPGAGGNIIEAGAIVIESAEDPERTSIAVLDRLNEEL